MMLSNQIQMLEHVSEIWPKFRRIISQIREKTAKKPHHFIFANGNELIAFFDDPRLSGLEGSFFSQPVHLQEPSIEGRMGGRACSRVENAPPERIRECSRLEVGKERAFPSRQ